MVALEFFYRGFGERAEVASGVSRSKIFLSDECILHGFDVVAREPQEKRPLGGERADWNEGEYEEKYKYAAVSHIHIVTGVIH